MPTSTIKICSNCGMDLNGHKRIKDANGAYFCHACWTSRQPKTASASTNGSPPTPPPIPAQAKTTSKVCSNCRSPIGALQQQWDWQGHVVCLTCRDLLQDEKRQRDEAATADIAQKAAETSKQETQELQETGRRRHLLRNAVGSVLAAILCACIGLSPGEDEIGRYVLSGIAVFFLGFAIYGFASYRAVLSRAGLSAREDLQLLGLSSAKWGAILLISIVISVVLIWGSARLGGETGGWIGTSIVVIAFLLVANQSWETRCPNCGKRFVAVTEHSENVGQYQESIKKTQAMNIRSSIRDGGQVIGQVDVPVTENHIVDVVRVQKRCKSCSHRWAVTAKQRRYFQ